MPYVMQSTKPPHEADTSPHGLHGNGGLVSSGGRPQGSEHYSETLPHGRGCILEAGSSDSSACVSIQPHSWVVLEGLTIQLEVSARHILGHIKAITVE